MKAVFSYEFAYDAGATQVGAKAWNMARMARWGFVVPKGLAIGVEVYKEILRRPHVAELVAKVGGISAAEIGDENSVELLRDLRSVIENESLPDALVRELSGQLSELGLLESSLAIRSSAIGEDGEKNAFAGVHESFLNVRGLDDILKAVLKCFASLWTPQAVAYRRRFEFADLDICGAVLICEMVVAENTDAPVAAGVAFSADPETGWRDVFAIESVAGLGDKLVGGAVTPTSTKVLASISGFEYLGEYAAPMPQAAMDELLLNLWRLHWAFGDGETAQDVEWAYDGKSIVMLQVRPVTSLPNPSYSELQTQPQIWSNANFKEVLSGIMSPLGWSLIPQYSAERFFDIHHISGYQEPKGMQIARRFAGWAYVDVSIVQYSGYDAWGILPEETNKSFGGFQPEIKLPENVKVKNSKRSMALMSVLRAVWRGHKQLPAIFNDVGTRAKAFVKQDLSGHSKQELLALWFSLGDEKWRVPFMLSNAMGSVWTGMARQMGAKYLPEAELDALISGLMSGQGNVVSAQHAYDLHDIAGYEGAEFDAALDAWLERHGHRGYNEFDIANPRWRETRAEIEQLARGLGVALHNPESAKKVRLDAEEKLSKLPFLGRKMLGWTMGKARDGFALRENGKSTLIAALGMSRHIALGFGVKMHDENLIEKVEDVFCLSFADIQAWAMNVWDGEGAKMLVADRQLQMSKWENAEPPTDVILVSAERVEQVQTQSAVTGNVIKGLGVSPGVASGVACKISDPSKPQGLKAGGVLVARSTDPSWTPLFLSASAIVVEIGGYLSHGAIVAREFGLPAVVNAAGAYDAIENGDELIVDGNVGKVVIGD